MYYIIKLHYRNIEKNRILLKLALGKLLLSFAVLDQTSNLISRGQETSFL